MRRRLTVTAALGAALVAVLAPATGTAGAVRTHQPADFCAGSSESVGLFAYGNGRVVRNISVPVCGHGGLTVTFAGDPAACAAAGLCGYAGTETESLTGAGELDIVTFRRDHRSSTAVTLALDEGADSSAVARTVSPGQTTSCSDTTGDDTGGGLFSSAAAPGRSRFTIGLTPQGSQLLGTRCAGPLAGDLRGALPTQTLPVAALARGGRTIDLQGTRPFTAHGFTGTVQSTVTLALGRPHVQRPSRSPGAGHGVHRVHETQLTETERAVALTGAARATVSAGPAAALCAPLDACGLAGTITLTPGTLRAGSLQLYALARGRRPLTQMRAALDLTGGPPPRPRIPVGGAGELSTRGRVAAALEQGAAACRDATDLSALTVAARALASGQLQVTLLQPLTGAADGLRTRCPGPDLGEHVLAGAVVPRAVWRRRTFAVALHGTRFSDGPYRVAIDSSLRLVLRRVRVRSKLTLAFAGD